MNIQYWITQREADWKRLDTILKQVEKKGIKTLRANEIKELASLYRIVSADLSRAKTYNLGNSLIQNLQNLTSRAYSQIYQGSRRQNWQGVIDFYLWGFPKILRETWRYTAIATAILLVGAAIARWYARVDSDFISLIVPEHLITKVREEHKLWMGSIVGIEPLASSGIMINNIQVSFAAVAGGITGGLFTIYLLFYNGISLGAISSLVEQNDLSYPFWAFVFPHGSLELPAIFIAGGAGLLIAKGLLLPGEYRRSQALSFYGRKAGELVFGIIPMLIIAGTIEGFFSPSPLIPDPIKYFAGMTIFTLFYIYCARKKKDINTPSLAEMKTPQP